MGKSLLSKLFNVSAKLNNLNYLIDNFVQGSTGDVGKNGVKGPPGGIGEDVSKNFKNLRQHLFKKNLFKFSTQTYYTSYFLGTKWTRRS